MSRSSRITVRLEPTEHVGLQRLAVDLDTHPSTLVAEIVRQAVNGGGRSVRLVQPRSVFDSESSKELRKIGINFNQIVRSSYLGLLPREAMATLDDIRASILALVTRLS